MCPYLLSIKPYGNYRSLLQKSPVKKRQYSTKETYNLINPTDRSHHICPIKRAVSSENLCVIRDVFKGYICVPIIEYICVPIIE